MKKKDYEPEPPPIYDDPTLSPLSAKILQQLAVDKRRTTSGLARDRCFRYWSRNTIKNHLQGLVRKGLARKHGKGKATWYTL